VPPGLVPAVNDLTPNPHLAKLQAFFTRPDGKSA
jgi:hypothetical protein